MTTRLSARGQVVIPNEVRKQHGYRTGDDFMVLSAENGDILLRPVRRGTKKGFFDALRALRGLEVPERNKELIQPIKL